MISPKDQDDLDVQVRARSGDVENEIRSAISEEHASIVVMGTHGRGFVRRMFIGSVTQDLLRKIPVPVITVSHASHPTKFSRILFATDLAESFREEFEFVVNFARRMAAELVVFRSD